MEILFHRGARKITLTKEGILLRRRAEEILALVDRTERELMEQEELVEGRIVIGCGELAATKFLEYLKCFSGIGAYKNQVFDISRKVTYNAGIEKSVDHFFLYLHFCGGSG